MPPSNCRASSSRNCHNSHSFRNARTAAGPNRRCTSLSDRSAGRSQSIPAPMGFNVAKDQISFLVFTSPFPEYYSSNSVSMQLDATCRASNELLPAKSDGREEARQAYNKITEEKK